MIMSFSRFHSGLMASFALAIVISTPAVAQQANNQAMVDLVIQVQQLQDEVRMLRGMLEDQTMELENLSNRQRDQYLDLDQRITGLRGAPPATLRTVPGSTDDGSAMTRGASATGTELASSRPQPAVTEDVPEVREALDTPSSVTG